MLITALPSFEREKSEELIKNSDGTMEKLALYESTEG
jgi:hypothetical protein